MNFKTFCETENIPYLPFYYFISDTINDDGSLKKIPIGEKNNLNPEDIKVELTKRNNLNKPFSYSKKDQDGNYININLSESEIESLTKSYTIFLKHHPTYYCIDVDDKTINSMNDFIKLLNDNNVDETIINHIKLCSWAKGNTKGIHIYIKLLNVPNYSNQLDVFNYFDGDLIKKNNMWEGITKLINYNDVEPIDFNVIKPLFKSEQLNPSIKPIQPIKEIKQEIKPVNKSEPIISDKNEVKNYIDLCIEYDVFKKISGYQNWLIIGLLIKNTFGDEGIDLFNEISSLMPKYDGEQQCKQFYNDLNRRIFSNDKNPITLGSLIYIIKETDETIYNKINTQKKTKSEYNILFDLSTGNLGNYFKNIHKPKISFIFSNGKLYYFNGIYWKEDDIENKPILNNYIDEVLYIELFKLYQKYELELQNKREDKSKELKEIKKNIQKLRDHQTRKKYIGDICCKLTNNDIIWNNKHNLFCFENKVYNIDENKFVEPKQDYYINMSCGYNYNDNYDLNLLKDIENFINQIFPNPEIRNTYMTVASTSLSGLTLEQFTLANGCGGNGKGVLNELLLESIGNYSYVIQPNLLTSPIKLGSNPELANCDSKRLVLFREPEGEYTFNCAVIKELTGGSEINARLNYSNKTKTKICMTLIGECNKKPKLSESGESIQRRLIDIHFEAKYVDKSEYNLLDEEERKNVYVKNIYYKSPEFKEKYKQALFIILTKYYNNYKNNSYQLNIPDCVKFRNMEYMKMSDDYYNFIEDNFEKTDNKKDIIKLKEVYEIYKNTEDYSNLSKEQKRKNNYKNFTSNLETNLFIKRFIKTDSDKTKILTNYKLKEMND